MPDHSHDNTSSDRIRLAIASEGQLWDSLSPEERAQILGQSITGEADNSNNKNSVYQKEGKAYESMPYTSLPPHVQFAVSNRLHEAGYFQETYGGNIYEVEGDDRYECKDCEQVFTTEEDFRVHRKINHDDNGESETESQEAYYRALQIDPDLTKDNLEWARKVIRGESARQEFPQNDPPTGRTPPLPKGRKEYDDNPNHYFYDNKLFKRGSRNAYRQEGVPLTEARALIELEDKILNKYGWESTKEIERSTASREVFATEVAKEVNVRSLHPRTIRILDSVNKPFLVNTLTKLAGETEIEDVPYRGDVHEEGSTQDIAPFSQQGEPVIHQDYDPEHPHEHNAFDQNFGDKVAEEDTDEYEVDVDEYLETGEPIQKIPTDKRAYEEEITPEEWNQADLPERKEQLDQADDFVPFDDITKDYGELHDKTQDLLKTPEEAEEEIEEPEKEVDWDELGEAEKTCPECGFYSNDETELHSHIQDHKADEEHTGKHTEIADAIQRDNPEYSRDRAMKIANSQIHKYNLESYSGEDFPFEKEETTVTAEPDLLQNVNTDVLQVDGEEYDPEEKVDKKAEEAKIIQQYTGYKPKAGEAVGDILDGAIDVPLERETVEEEIYNRKLDGYNEDKIARELFINHGLEYNNAIEKIRSIEVSDDDRVAKTLFGKKLSDLNKDEIGEMKTLAGEAKKRLKGGKNARR